MPTLQFLETLAAGINSNRGTVNCAHCALRFDEHLASGENLGLGPVPRQSANLFSHPLFKAGKIKRSTTKDKRLVSRVGPPSADFREICSLDNPDETPEFEIDLTVTANPTEQVRFLPANKDTIVELLQLLPRRMKDGSAYGFIVLTHASGASKGHIINFFVDNKNQVYFIDAQRSTFDQQITQQLNMRGFRPEIFYILSMPPEGLKPILKKESPTTVKNEIEDVDMLNPTIPNPDPKNARIESDQEKFNRLLAACNQVSPSVKDVCKLAFYHSMGIGTTRNEVEAFNCYLRATKLDKNDWTAWNNLKCCYENGTGTNPNPEEAHKCANKIDEINRRNASIPSTNNPPLLFSPPKPPVVTIAPKPVSQIPMSPAPAVSEADYKLQSEELALLREELTLKDRKIALKEKENAQLRQELMDAKSSLKRLAEVDEQDVSKRAKNR